MLSESSLSGKERRLGRLVQADGRALLVAVDHTVTTGALESVEDVAGFLKGVTRGGADGIVAHRGLAVRVPQSRHTGLVIQLFGNTSHSGAGDTKIKLCDVDTAVALGADAVSVQLTLGVSPWIDREALASVGLVARSCDHLGMPLLIMAAVCNDHYDRDEAICHAAVAAIELGGDLVKIPAPSIEALEQLCKNAAAPILVAGGPKIESWPAYLRKVQASMAVGAAGVCVGRQLFHCADPCRAVTELHALIHSDE